MPSVVFDVGAIEPGQIGEHQVERVLRAPGPHARTRHGHTDKGRVERGGGSLLAMGYGILPCRLNSFTLANPGSAYLKISWVRCKSL
jgi:hypothetical protein